MRTRTILVFLVLFCCTLLRVANGDELSIIPEYRATLKPQTTISASWSASCFQHTNITLESIDPSGAEITLVASNASSRLCRDMYLIATPDNYHIKRIFLRGTHKISIVWRGDQEYTDVLQNGLFFFSIQDGAIGSLHSLWKFSGMFFGKHQIRNNIEFLRRYMNITLPKRTTADPNISESEIESGDQFQILNLNRGEPLILYGTGGLTDHVTTALWMEDGLYIVESAGSSETHGKQGIIRTPFRQWLADVKRTQQNVVLLKLDPKRRAQYDVKRATAFFKSVEGLPYGFRNFIYGWIDTMDDNFPTPLTHQSFLVGLALLEKLSPTSAQRYILSALNMRLGAKNLTLHEILFELKLRNITFGELISMPEKDDWVYSDGYAMVCNVFVMRMYKEGGMFREFSFEATETTPRDTYELDLYDKTGQYKPASCRGLDDSVPYCQIAGAHKLRLPGYSSIPPYDNMFEKCGALPPAYVRTPPKC